MKLVKLKNSSTTRVLLIAGLILLLLIPMTMVKSVIAERSHLYRLASNEITASWGRDQLITVPVLTIPYLSTDASNGSWVYETRYHHLRPSLLRISVNIDTEIRRRGIYKVPVYSAEVQIQGEFDLADLPSEEVTNLDLEIVDTYIQIPVADSRAIREIISFTWEDESMTLQPQWFGKNNSNLTLSAGLEPELLEGEDSHEFELIMRLTGSHRIGFNASSQDTRIDIEANWGSPGFYGIYLPDSYQIDPDSFTANWDIKRLLPDPAQSGEAWLSANWNNETSNFGVRLIQPVDNYQLVTRSAKYAVLFISLSFLVYFFTEIMSGLKLHPVQYLLVGGANCIFYLLLLSLAEHIEFMLAYLTSATASVTLIALYSSAILKSQRHGSMIFILLSSLYVYLYLTLRSEAYALLTGSIGLFSILAAVMYMSRNVDWYRNKSNLSE